MIADLDAVAGGFELDADAVVVGSGPGGAIAACNLAQAGMRVVLLEAGPRVRRADMTRDGPTFLRRFYWEGGTRLLRGDGIWPAMSGRALGGSSVVNSAIFFRLPDAVRREWITEAGLTQLDGPALDESYDRIQRVLRVEPTPPEAWGPRNLLTRDILRAAGLDPKPLPRAVAGCQGGNDCLTGCISGAKQSVDKNYVAMASEHGAQVMTCAHVERVTLDGDRATGVIGHIADPETQEPIARFTVRAPRVILAAGTMHTPVILKRSGITCGGRVGATFQCHLSSFALGVFPQVIDPWVGATQGYGAFSDRVPGMKFEALWAPTPLIGAEWGPSGPEMYRLLPDFKHALMIPLVYRATKVNGRVGLRFDGMPDTVVRCPPSEMWVVMSELKRVVDVMLTLGARYVYTGVHGVPEQIRTPRESEALLSRAIRPMDVTMTANHTFGSCRMSADPRDRVVGIDGRVDGLRNLWLCDASVFPSPTAVNPQATVMALSDLTSRGIIG
ncbi:MAG TPA: GMC family oxidoreductase [Myxococcota bacterium]|nr:GMC family oxidoreductase [Myxococcota bacterium]